MIISTIGLGKLGYPMAQFLTSTGFEINVFDNNKEYVSLLKSNKITFYESGLSKYLKNKNNLNFCNSVAETLINSEICFITVPTPSKISGQFSNNYILDVLDKISEHLNNNKKTFANPLSIVINSTVSPGSFENELIPFMKSKNLIVNEDFYFIYNPYFVALGNTINNLENPDMLLIGSSSQKAENLMKKFYCNLYDNPNFKFMNLVEAEIVKISLNAYLTLKISYSNSLNNTLRNNKNVDIFKILDAVGSDSRVGKKFLMPGGPFSGPCLPRDTSAFKNFINFQGKYGLSDSSLVDAVDKINSNTLKLLQKDFAILRNDFEIKRFGFLGLGYRANTTNYDDSFALKLFDYCLEEKFQVSYYDNYIQKKK